MKQHRNAARSNESCRILLIAGQLGGGGLEQQLCYLLQAMDHKVCRPGLVVWNYDESEVNVRKVRDLGVPIWGYPTSASSYWKMMKLIRLARRLKPQIIHSYGFFTNFAAYCAARASQAIPLGSVRGEIDLSLSETRPILGRLSAAFPPDQISNSNAAAKLANKPRSWFKPRTMIVVPNALDLMKFQDAPLPTGRPIHLLGIGSLIPLKRWDRLLQIGRELRQRNLPCVVEIAGDGPLRRELESQATRMGIADMVHLLGYRRDIPDLIVRARAVIHTADNEGSPNAVMEAMASGRPVIATDVGDVSRLIENGKTGFVVPREDTELLIKRVVEVVTDDALAARLAAAARNYAQREFQLPRLAERTIEAYRSTGWKP